MIHLGDITTINGAEIEPVDVITFGAPCQDLSVAGKRAGMKSDLMGDEENTRSGLFFHAVRIIREMREATNGLYPTFAIYENVPGAFSSNRGYDFRSVLEELARVAESNASVPMPDSGKWQHSGLILGEGYSIAWRLFDAQYLGVPQRRKRIAVILDLGGHRAGEILFEREGVYGDTDEGIPPWKGVAKDPAESTGVCDCKTLKIRSGCDGGGKGPLIQNDLSATLATHPDQTLFLTDRNLG